MTAVYNEIDPFAAAWLRELIKAGHIAPGEVWEDDIRDIRPRDLRGVVQFHAFAGIGVWSYAARRAGWPDSRPIWTGSCPCQPFSAAGAGGGFADERHLWPHFHHLIRECSPAVVVGEQVASKDADAWIDLVQADMEALGYAFGAVPFPSASVGAPHIRDRTYWLAHADVSISKQRRPLDGRRDQGGNAFQRTGFSCDGDVGRLGVASGSRCARIGGQPEYIEPLQAGQGDACGMADTAVLRCDKTRQHECGPPQLSARSAEHGGMVRSTGPTNSFWSDSDWLFCRDGKWRPVESGAFPLAHGAAARVGRLRGYGNAINAEQARIFIEEVQEIIYPIIEA